MIKIAPFDSFEEHQEFCLAGNVELEEDSLGFKIFNDFEKLGLSQIQIVENAAYILTLSRINDKISNQLLSELFSQVMVFLDHIGVSSVLFPIKNESDAELAAHMGFEKVCDTLYAFENNEK